MIKTLTIKSDIIIIGAGGAGITASLQASKHKLKVLCLSKVHPLRSHTIAAKGGINAALGNVAEDKWQWHAYDTIKGSDWLADQDAVEFMCKNAALAIRELENMGVPFSRLENGKIYQRLYGGQSTYFGEKTGAYRACSVADRTGHSILNILYQQALKNNVKFLDNHFAIDLLMEEGRCKGLVALNMEEGIINYCIAPYTIIATGGYGQVYRTNTSSSICTGDGNAMVLRAGLPLKDMEFIQFHPTGLYGSGFLVTEAARSEGGFLVNNKGERFMEKYAPGYADLASRDVIARAMSEEIAIGNGCGSKKDHLLLKLNHINKNILETKLPEVIDIAKRFVGINVRIEPIPVVPSVHYTMGGIPTNLQSEVIDTKGQVVPGLMAIGEAACVSVHGANRLGCNSLLDLIVFGRAAADRANENIAKQNSQEVYIKDINILNTPVNKIESLLKRKKNYNHDALLNEMKDLMSLYVGVFRNEEGLLKAEERIVELYNYLDKIGLQDKNLIWNNELSEVLELENMLLESWATIFSARKRTESRGSHYRNDFSTRNDTNWMKHSIIALNNNKMGYKNTEVRILHDEKYNPKARQY